MMNKFDKAKNLKIAYIGGGSRGWAWKLMSDLAKEEMLSGELCLYDIDYEAAKQNEIVWSKVEEHPECKAKWNCKAVKTLKEALINADFVIISILPGTFDEMDSDVHLPEKYGIYQSVGDTMGPGGIVRALRTLPMFEEIAQSVKENCPDAWVINYTNPMSLCLKALYMTFPEIKAWGCCHEVFGTQKLLSRALSIIEGIEEVPFKDIKVNVVGVNHFTWLTEAYYKDIDLFPVYEKFCEKYSDCGYELKDEDSWLNKFFDTHELVKMDLFKRFGYIAAAGDRHLAEFCPGYWYIDSPERVEKWGFALTPVSWRKENRDDLIEESKRLVSGQQKFEIKETGEEGVRQIKAILGLGDFTTNINIPNQGQIPNLPIGAIVETNAYLTSGTLKPVFAGNIPEKILPLVSRVVAEQEVVARAVKERNLEIAFDAFIGDPLVTISQEKARELFDQMIENTKEYLKDYGV
ncbi:MAG: alpha-glucosidase/alpha-galactosidase [Clostridia bacterium]|nr:alpha-glucosidase/alpha-galactosidase [Clostridia bacterium]